MLGVVRRDWFWLASAMAAAGVTFVGFVVFGAYEGGYRAAATHAEAARLAAAQVSALEWESIATGRVPPAANGEVSQLTAQVAHEIRHAHVSADTRRALASYVPAVREEFRLIAAGQIVAARRVDEEEVDPAYRTLSASLRQAAGRNEQAANDARLVAVLGEAAVIVVGLTVASVSVFRFASARRALDAARMQERLLRETSQAKSDLISVVSHDLRTPLTSIVGYVEILRDENGVPVPDADRQQFLGIIKRNADRLLSIVNDLLFISRAEERRLVLDLSELSLGDVAAGMLESQRLRAHSGEIDLQLSVAPAPAMRGDRHRIEELIDNLLSNAIKFTPPGGSVRVSTGAADGRVWLEVSDTGVGISPVDQEHLFERFFRSPDVTGTPGAGLGLAIVKAIMDAHGGSVSVRSTPGQGTTFHAEFPSGEQRLAQGGAA